jgi:hypothetical protein
MTDADFLRGSFASLDVNMEFTEAVLVLRDDSTLCFCHRVGERTVKTTGTGTATVGSRVLSKIAQFRLNPKHLEIQFEDGSGWEALFESSYG